MFAFLRKKNILIAACILWAAFVFVLHVVKVEIETDSIKLFPHSDKVIHFTMFFVLAGLFVFAKQANHLNYSIAKMLSSTNLLIATACIIYGALLEYLQGTNWIMRDRDIWDWVADVVGSILGICVSLRVANKNFSIRSQNKIIPM